MEASNENWLKLWDARMKCAIDEGTLENKKLLPGEVDTNPAES